MTRAVVVVALVAVLAAVPAGAAPRAGDGGATAAARGHGAGKARRGPGRTARFAPLRGQVGKVRAKAPTAWSATPGFSVPAATPTPTPTPADPAATPTPTPTATATVPPISTKSVSVVSKEFSFTLSQAAVDAGDVRVQFDNSRAEDPHQLMLLKADQLFDVGELASGEVKRVTLPLSSGTWELFCPLPEHEELGMKAKLTVR